MSDDGVLEFVLERQAAKARSDRPRCWGRSSDALVLWALGKGPRPQTPGHPEREGGGSWRGDEVGRDYPYDEDDLGACEVSFEMAPPSVQVVMLPVLDEFRAWVREGSNRYGEKVRESAPSGMWMRGPGFEVSFRVGSRR